MFIIDIDGGWSTWNDIFDEEKNCTIIKRVCNNPEPSGNGQICFGESVDSDNSDCPSRILILPSFLSTVNFIFKIFAVDGEWGLWSEYSQCSARCGKGIKRRERECNSPSPKNGGNECEVSNSIDVVTNSGIGNIQNGNCRNYQEDCPG